MNNGLYFVFEGSDGAGKSTVMRLVDQMLAEKFGRSAVVPTRHPGTTKLGAHLRNLSKYPETIGPGIVVDPLSAQLFMVADASSFVSLVLKPSLEEGRMVLADRSNAITMIAYGLADGLTYSQIAKLLSLVEVPKCDRLYVLQCPMEVSHARMLAQSGGDRKGLDRFEKKGMEFFKRVNEVYDSLVTGSHEQLLLVQHSVSIDNVKYVDSSRPPEEVAQDIFRDILSVKANFQE